MFPTTDKANAKPGDKWYAPMAIGIDPLSSINGNIAVMITAR